MEEEVKIWENQEVVKHTKPRAWIPMVFEVFAFTTRKPLIEEENKYEELS